MNPEILVLDEPAAGLDPRGKTDILNRLCKFRDNSKNTLVIISHSMEDIALYSDEIITMAEGRVLMSGTPREVFAKHELLVKNGLNVPQVTQILAKLKKDGYNVDDSAYTLDDAKGAILDFFHSEKR